MHEKLQFKETLNSLITSRGLNPTKLARTIGISHTAIQNFLSGESYPKSDNLYLLAEFFGVTTDYLLTGIDAQIKNADGSSNLVQFKAHVEQPPRDNAGPYWGTSKEAPIISWASAGNAHAWEDQGSDVPQIPTVCKDANCYALQIEGDSMEPVYHAGDIVVVTPNTQAQQGDLVVAKTKHDDVYFKRLEFSRDQQLVRLVSYNPNYPVMEMKRSEVRFLHPIFSITRYFKGGPNTRTI